MGGAVAEDLEVLEVIVTVVVVELVVTIASGIADLGQVVS